MREIEKNPQEKFTHFA